jgi:hypothetical protein
MVADAVRNTLALYLGRPRTLAVRSPPIATIDCFEKGPEPGMRVFVTGGLSAVPLEQKNKGTIAQELLFACRGEHERDIVGLLDVIAEQIASRGTALERGEVLGPAGPIIDKSILTSLVSTLPVFLPDSAVFYPETPPILLVWLLPLSSKEAELARKLGPERFESLLDKMAETVDLYDLHRGEVVSA